MDYIHIGRIVATHGIGGELILKHELGKKSDFGNISAFFIEEAKRSFIPYFLEQAKVKDERESFIKLEGLSSKESAQRFVRKNVWLTQQDFDKVADMASPLSLIGFNVFNENKLLSMVEEVIEQTHQLLLRITFKNKEVYIPLHEETLDFIDREKREIHVTLPDGLLDVYM